MRSLSLLLGLGSMLLASSARGEDLLGLRVDYGPITGASSETRTITTNAAARWERVLYDTQDGQEHRVRGVPLVELVPLIKAPRQADTLVFVFDNGMQVPVRMADQAALADLFVAFEHGDAMRTFKTTYPIFREGAEQLLCPKVVYSRRDEGYTVWRYTNHLQSVKVVTWAAYQAMLAQPSRQAPTHAGWKLYAKNCQPCHGLGGQGAARGPDFISDLDAYRRVPPMAETDPGAQPSLHEKVSGRVGGQMPSLTHIPPSEIKELWRWLHAVHRGATR